MDVKEPKFSYRKKVTLILLLQSALALLFFCLTGYFYFQKYLEKEFQSILSQDSYVMKYLATAEIDNAAKELQIISSQIKGSFANLDLNVFSPYVLSTENVLLVDSTGKILRSLYSQDKLKDRSLDRNIFSNSVSDVIVNTFYNAAIFEQGLVKTKDDTIFIVAAIRIGSDKPTYLVRFKNIDSKVRVAAGKFGIDIEFKDSVIQFVHLSKRTTSKTVHDAVYFVVFLLLGIFSLTFLTSKVLVANITYPLHQLLAAIKSYTETGYGYKIMSTTKDEFSELIEAFNVMIDSSRLSLIDPMTNVFNRRYFDSELLRCCNSGRRKNDDNLSLAVFDIDFFKKINDVHGHAVGDEAICYLARILQEKFRASDIIARYGGEEFVIILKDSNFEGAVEVCNRVRLHIQNTSFHSKTNGKEIKLTVSCGVANAVQANYESAVLFDIADQALLISKQSGRNRVTASSAPVQLIPLKKAG